MPVAFSCICINGFQYYTFSDSTEKAFLRMHQSFCKSDLGAVPKRCSAPNSMCCYQKGFLELAAASVLKKPQTGSLCVQAWSSVTMLLTLPSWVDLHLEPCVASGADKHPVPDHPYHRRRCRKCHLHLLGFKVTRKNKHKRLFHNGFVKKRSIKVYGTPKPSL